MSWIGKQLERLMAKTLINWTSSAVKLIDFLILHIIHLQVTFNLTARKIMTVSMVAVDLYRRRRRSPHPSVANSWLKSRSIVSESEKCELPMPVFFVCSSSPLWESPHGHALKQINVQCSVIHLAKLLCICLTVSHWSHRRSRSGICTTSDRPTSNLPTYS